MVPFLDLKRITSSYQPAIDGAIARVVASGSFIRGLEVAAFETAYAQFTGTRYCVGVGNGFDALQLIFKAWLAMGELAEGDEVIVPANTYIASILAVNAAGLVPTPVEPDPATFNIDASRVAERIGPRTRAVLIVHLYGRNAMTDELQSLAERHALKVVEDNAQAAGCRWRGRRTGALGHAAAHSFFPTKNLGALGDGGAVTTDDERLAEMVRTLGHYGAHTRGLHNVKGINSRLDELQAAVLSVKLGRLESDNARRRNIARRYRSGIRNPDITVPDEPAAEGEHVWHLFTVRSRRREALRKALEEAGIETLIHYPVPPHQQGAYSEWNSKRFPLTEEIHRQVLSLPLYPQLTDSEVDEIIAALQGRS